jgi:hypothetical protein
MEVFTVEFLLTKDVDFPLLPFAMARSLCILRWSDIEKEDFVS